MCAAPDYLTRRGTPQIPEDLAGHDCLSYSYVAVPDEWHFIGAGGERVVKVNGPIVTSHRHVLRTAAVRGLGIAYGPIDFFRDDLGAGRLVRVLGDYQLPEATIYAVYPAGRRLSAKVKVFNDFMARFFAASTDISVTMRREASRCRAARRSPPPHSGRAETPDRTPC